MRGGVSVAIQDRLAAMPARGRRYGPVKPTHCVKPGCNRPLTARKIAAKKYTCYSCDNRRRGHVPVYVGPCTRCGDRPGRGRSSMCRICLITVKHKKYRRERVLRAVLGEALPIEWVLTHLDDPRAQAFVRKFLEAIQSGGLSFIRRANPYPMAPCQIPS